ncbi:MAG: hypothetical protein AMXMBFR13_16960 [Phycisphaerae bacterium]
MIHLDTNTVVAYLRGNEQVMARFETVLPDAGISAIVLAELLFGARISARSADNLKQIAAFIRLAPPVPFDQTCASICAESKLIFALLASRPARWTP